MKIDFRARSQMGGKAKHEKYKKMSLERVNGNTLFDDLNIREKRERILLEQDSKCSLCHIEQIWNNQPLKFDLDHIDGDKQNNSRKNLRLICPNCHSQTPTYKVGNNKNPGGRTFSDDEIITALKQNNSAYKAMKSLGMNPHGGNYTRLRCLIRDKNIQLPYNV